MILLFAPESDPQQQLMSQLSVKRNMPTPGRKDVIALMHSGINTIVFENENSIFGACASSITLVSTMTDEIIGIVLRLTGHT
jgi:hypothetical protein